MISRGTWVWSDTHFGHRNIIQFQQRPATHEIIMLSEWASRVRDDDTILHLGDVWLRAPWTRWAAIIARMPGRKLLVLGNHDKAGVARYERAGFEVVDPFVWKGIAFTHRPVTPDFPGHPEWDVLGARTSAVGWEDWHTNIHGHIHLNEHRPEDGSLYADRRYINVSVEAIDLKPVQIGNLL